MAYASNILTSIYGRRLGLQRLSTVETGGSRGPVEFLVGAEQVREGISSAPTTSQNLRAWGVSAVPGTSAASTPVYTLDPPIPGVRKPIWFPSTDSAVYVKTGSGEYIAGTSLGSSATAIRSSGGGFIELMGLTTAYWAALNISSTAVNGVAFQATT